MYLRSPTITAVNIAGNITLQIECKMGGAGYSGMYQRRCLSFYCVDVMMDNNISKIAQINGNHLFFKEYWIPLDLRNFKREGSHAKIFNIA